MATVVMGNPVAASGAIQVANAPVSGSASAGNVPVGQSSSEEGPKNPKTDPDLKPLCGLHCYTSRQTFHFIKGCW